jgi:hypothetical protein
MSAFEDRQDAAPAIVAPAAEQPAPANADTADLEAVAAVEGSTEDELADSPAADAEDAVEVDAAARNVSDTATDTAPDVADVVLLASPDAGEVDDDEAPLLDDTLEEGIASVFAALQAAAGKGEIGESDEPFGPLSDAEAVDGITFRLLGELDRLWHRAA